MERNPLPGPRDPTVIQPLPRSFHLVLLKAALCRRLRYLWCASTLLHYDPDEADAFEDAPALPTRGLESRDRQVLSRREGARSSDDVLQPPHVSATRPEALIPFPIMGASTGRPLRPDYPTFPAAADQLYTVKLVNDVWFGYPAPP